MAKRILRKYYIKTIRRLRHRKGYGVHSPFAYNLITKVIEEPFMYYCYNEIERLKKEVLPLYTENISTGKRKKISFKKGTLLFRLVNHFKPQHILEIGSSWGISTLYLYEGNPSAELRSIEPDKLVCGVAREITSSFLSPDTFSDGALFEAIDNYLLQYPCLQFVCIHRLANEQDYPLLLDRLQNHLGPETVIVIDEINGNRARKVFWTGWMENNNVRVTMDLYDIGLIFCNPKLNKQDYVVAF
ncbi:hypothetical protein [Coprobacter tertius]|uniref:O-methyltransferase n=1 Tax=Coprobacter tertius TaxID=2944915 RepID=A0ABT1ME84_9BACT|nr:hypothetical protein [Coprobacter tertius]MCP9610679.1 hypothetical protein [Coprobacter tertius]